jgi:hypothetical protein
MKKLSIFTLLLALAWTATTPANAPATAPKSEFKNLKVLPQDIPREQLLATMRSFTRGLGVRCDHCHVVTATEPKQVLDFPNDAKETKRAARVMIQMVSQINGTFIPRAQAAAGDPTPAAGAAPEMRVTCWTCHRGKPEPEAPPAPPNGPQGAPPPH